MRLSLGLAGRCHCSLYTTESSIASVVLSDGRQHVRGREFRPHQIGKVKFSVSAFPQEKVAEALLAASADQKVHVAHGARVRNLVHNTNEALTCDRTPRTLLSSQDLSLIHISEPTRQAEISY